MSKQNAVEAYRAAAIALWNLNEQEAAYYIRSPKDDPGEWAPNADAIIYLEMKGGKFGLEPDQGTIPTKLSYWSSKSFDNGLKLSAMAGGGFIEPVNPAVSAVYDWE